MKRAVPVNPREETMSGMRKVETVAQATRSLRKRGESQGMSDLNVKVVMKDTTS